MKHKRRRGTETRRKRTKERKRKEECRDGEISFRRKVFHIWRTDCSKTTIALNEMKEVTINFLERIKILTFADCIQIY